jgi:hypothetical protein
MPVELQICCLGPAADQPGNKIRPTQQDFAGAPPLAVPPQAFKPLRFCADRSQFGTKHDETTIGRDELSDCSNSVIGD